VGLTVIEQIIEFNTIIQIFMGRIERYLEFKVSLNSTLGRNDKVDRYI